MSLPSPIKIDDRQIRDSLSPFHISLSDGQIASIREYVLLLLKWNRTISLTSIEDPIEIVARHFGESMFPIKLLPVENCRLADVGTGAGFPGMALKIICPSLQLLLIESNKKKCVFLSEVIRALELDGVEIRCERFEEIRPETVQCNIITSRAVGEFKQLLQWAAKALARRGHLMMWLGADDCTRIASTPGWIWQPAARILDSQRRFILIGRPVEAPVPGSLP